MHTNYHQATKADIIRGEELVAGFSADGTPQYREPDQAPRRRRRRPGMFTVPTAREAAMVALAGFAIWLGYVAMAAAADLARYGVGAIVGG